MSAPYWLYRRFMRLAHRHGWHHTDRMVLENGDVQHWCKWCGLRQTLHREHFAGMRLVEDQTVPPNTVTLVNLEAFRMREKL